MTVLSADSHHNFHGFTGEVVAGLLQIFLGSFGVGRFYLGDAGTAVAQTIAAGMRAMSEKFREGGSTLYQ